MQKWKYKYIECKRDDDSDNWLVIMEDDFEHRDNSICGDSITEYMNELGSEGWELVGISQDVYYRPRGNGLKTQFDISLWVFKRPLE